MQCYFDNNNNSKKMDFYSYKFEWVLLVELYNFSMLVYRIFLERSMIAINDVTSLTCKLMNGDPVVVIG